MSRLLITCLTLGIAQLGVACDNDASRAGSTGVASAVAAPSDVARVRDEYRREKQADLALLDKGVADAEAKERSMSATAKTDYHSALASLKVERDEFAHDLGAADSSLDSTWDATKARLDAQWTHLKATADKAVGAATYKPAAMTCDEFVALRDVERPKVLYWAEGWNQKGKPTGAAVDVRESDGWLPLVVADCTTSPKASFAKVVEKHASAAKTPVPAPGTMTCTEFITYDETSKPKVVYWAEGFNREGDATVAEVDVDATDRLVPTLVEDCKQTPKATLWERIKKHL